VVVTRDVGDSRNDICVTPLNFFPDEVDAWHDLGEIPTGEWLFNCQRVADILDGTL
jgi:hypothetical protein